MMKSCKEIVQDNMRWLEEYGLVMPPEDRKDILDTFTRVLMERDVKEHGYVVDAVHILAMHIKDKKYRELLYDFMNFSAPTDSKKRNEFIHVLDELFYNPEHTIAEIKISKEYLYAIAKVMQMHDEGKDVVLKIKRGNKNTNFLVVDGETFAMAVGERRDSDEY